MNLLSLAIQIAAKLKKVCSKVESLNRKVRRLRRRVESLENQLLTGLTVIGQNVQVNTMFVTIEGVVVSVADDGVQLREASEDIVLIPFAKITSVQ